MVPSESDRHLPPTMLLYDFSPRNLQKLRIAVFLARASLCIQSLCSWVGRTDARTGCSAPTAIPRGSDHFALSHYCSHFELTRSRKNNLLHILVSSVLKRIASTALGLFGRGIGRWDHWFSGEVRLLGGCTGEGLLRPQSTLSLTFWVMT